MVLSSALRWMVSSLIAIGLQLCCCKFANLSGGCCGERSGAFSPMELEDHQVEAGGHHECCHEREHAAASAPAMHDHAPSTPGSPANHHHGGCACGSHDKAPSAVAKILPDLALHPFALPAATINRLHGLTPAALSYAAIHAVGPPTMTLLRQHCALNT